ncbi:hypothetical protein CDD81_1241 [Ophiocordyceps australis]|uniref:Rhodopsin domain-containing protein n=1 Tax=Ophiocordyceps australis TaxID=1399860 RepID=A0A2C5YF10_9HYPO|nr:hypothetical protein CDD81_1241 [Ophiocordyceps australis]
MSIYSDAPSLRAFKYDKPTLLVCWWATSFSALMILLRLAGRFIRTERLFLEDKISALALVPLVLRMVCVHFILTFGTNNADFSSLHLDPDQLRHKSIASGLVLASRFLYAATLWILKYAILEFLRRLTDLAWSRAHQATLIVIRWALVATFIAVLVSTLAECRPFNHYWQVLPDPGGQCRQGFVQLITMATCNIATDILLVVFPIPIIVQSQMAFRRKLQLIVLFSLSLSVVGVTLYRLPHILRERGRQQYRSLLASIELLFATAAANALVLGSFVRDRGIKKKKFRPPSMDDSLDRTSNPRRPTLQRQWGSDEDLVRDVGLNVDSDLHSQAERGSFVPAPSTTIGATHSPGHDDQDDDDDDSWKARKMGSTESKNSSEWLPPDAIAKEDKFLGRQTLALLHVGGPMDASLGGSISISSTNSASCTRASGTSSTLDPSSTRATPVPSRPAATKPGPRRGSAALLQDLGLLLSPLNSRPLRGEASDETELRPMRSRMAQSQSAASMGPELKDPGGLLK